MSCTTPRGYLTPEPKKPHLERVKSLASPCGTPSNKDDGSPRSLLRIPASPCLEKLGFGTGVNVFLYERSPVAAGKSRSPWAIKKMGRGQDEKSFIAKRLEKEAKILKTLSHPNIIGYRGYKRNSDGSRILAIENGEKSLQDMIESLRDEADSLDPFDPDDILKVVSAMASALHYLHTEKKLLHGDVKSANILIKGDFDAIKLCDFGVTLQLDEDLKAREEKETQGYVGTGPWTAKEVFEEDGVISNKTDIFALGCVIFEMLALESPHVNLLPNDSTDLDENDTYDESEYEEALGTRPNLPEDLDLSDERYRTVLSIFYACTEEEPNKRPSADVILEIIKNENPKL